MTRAEMKKFYNVDVTKVKMLKGLDGIRYWYSEKSVANGEIQYSTEDGWMATQSDAYMDLFGDGTHDLSGLETR